MKYVCEYLISEELKTAQSYGEKNTMRVIKCINFIKTKSIYRVVALKWEDIRRSGEKVNSFKGGG